MVKTKSEGKSPRRLKSLGPASRSGTRLTRTAAIGGPSAAGKIRVVVRVRPFNERELSGTARIAVKISDDESLTFDPKEDFEPFFYHGVEQQNWDVTKRPNKNLHFSFDRVYGFDSSNADVFGDSVEPLIENLMNGYNCSVFAYGATGAGKTHTMIGSEDDCGVTFLTVTRLFERKAQLSVERDFEIRMSYLEVYNETVKDLLNPGLALQLRENGIYGVLVSGLEVHRIDDYNSLFRLLEIGNRNRTQHPTDANSESSRSHAVFQVYLKMNIKMTGEVRAAKLSMIDLAGSERGAATGFAGARFAEGANINKSLLALGNCINALSDGQRHVPYRDSKLTRLLKDSLGGNCRTVMITNVSPSANSYEDTYNTLKYATRAKNIKSNMMKNVVNCEGNLNYYKKLAEELGKKKDDLVKEIEELTKENKDLKLQVSPNYRPTAVTETTPQVRPCTSSSAPHTVVSSSSETELKRLFTVKAELQKQASQFESMEQLVAVRKHMKRECNSRLSGICTEDVEKVNGRKRFGNVVHRLDLQANAFRKDLANLTEKIDDVDRQIQGVLEKTPELTTLAEREECHTKVLKADKRIDHLQKVSSLQQKELKMYGHLVEQLCLTLKPCYMQLRGFGHATEDLQSKYQSLVQQVQGIRSVTWEDESSESDDILPLSDLPCPNDGDKCRDETNLDKTFELPNNRPKSVLSDRPVNKKVVNLVSTKSAPCVPGSLKRGPAAQIQAVSAKHHMVKLYKSPSNKRPGKYMSPKNKENQVRTTGAVTHVTASSTSLARQRFNTTKAMRNIIKTSHRQQANAEKH